MDYIDGQAILKKYAISVGELVRAIIDGLPAYDAVTGKRVVDQDSMIARPKYETEGQAAEVVDLLIAGEAARKIRKGQKPFGVPLPDDIPPLVRERCETRMIETERTVRQNMINHFLKNSKVYEFPDGQERPQELCAVFPLCYDTFSREHYRDVTLGAYGEGETVHKLYQKQIGAMRFPVAAVEARFGEGGEGTAKDKPAGNKQKRLPITQKTAALLCGVSEKQIGKWDNGVQTPDRYPGRYDLDKLKPWAETYQQRKFISKTARAIKHASPMDPQIIAETLDEDSGDVFN